MFDYLPIITRGIASRRAIIDTRVTIDTDVAPTFAYIIHAFVCVGHLYGPATPDLYSACSGIQWILITRQMK